VTRLGTFALVRDPRALPSSPEGVGVAHVQLILDGVATAMSSDATGHAALEPMLDGSTVVYLRVGSDAALSARALIGLSPDGSTRPLGLIVFEGTGPTTMAWTAPGSLPMTLRMDRTADHAEGHFAGTVRDEDGGEHTVELAFTAELAPIALDPVRVCP
jgi:hypothetical protein